MGESTKEEQEGTTVTKRRQDEPQPSIVAEESRKRKQEGVLSVEDRQASKAQAEEEGDLEDGDMQRVVGVAWCAGEQRNVRRCREGTAQEKPIPMIGPRMHTTVRNCKTPEEAKVRSKVH